MIDPVMISPGTQSKSSEYNGFEKLNPLQTKQHQYDLTIGNGEEAITPLTQHLF